MQCMKDKMTRSTREIAERRVSMPGQGQRRRAGVDAIRLALGGLVLLAMVFLAGCSARHYRKSVDRAAYGIVREKQVEAFGRTNQFQVESPADALRQRLLLQQDLPYSSEASLGSSYLDPIEHWPRDNYLNTNARLQDKETPASSNAPVVLNLVEALQVAARNSRDYQANKEDVFRSALDLDLERDNFRSTFAGLFSGSYDRNQPEIDAGGETQESFDASSLLSVTKRLKSGAQLTLQLGWDILRLLQPNQFTSHTAFGDASITIPLLRGAGRHIVTEPLTQAERDVLYALYNFENFKRGFAVDVASEYLSVLQRRNQVANAEENYRGLIASSRRARRLLDKGDLPPIQVDQAIQDELSARNRWVSARESYSAALDGFKLRLGLPTDALMELDTDELDKLSRGSAQITAGATDIEYDTEVPPADAPIVLEEPSDENAGAFELPPERAIRIALENRLDLRVVHGRVFDAQREVVVAADRLKPELSLFGSASIGGDDSEDLDANNLDYTALLNLDLPLERTAEAIDYRQSYLALESAVRGLQSLEDAIKLDILNRLRNLREARESLRIQALSVELAKRRVRGANLSLQAGRVEIRDLLEAQEDLLSAQNSLTAARVDYRVAELAMQRDLGVLEVDATGMWKEYEPEM